MTFDEAKARYPHAPADPDVHAALFHEIKMLQESLALFKRIVFEKQQKIAAVRKALDAP